MAETAIRRNREALLRMGSRQRSRPAILTRAAAVVIALLIVAPHAWSADPVVHIRNFGKVNDRLYRGGAPTPAGLKELADIKIITDLDLREPGEGTESERRAAESAGIKYINVPLSGFSAPTEGQIKRILSLITPDDAGRTFVHCRRGKDRTGTVIACYRIEHDGWSPQKALAEANSYGMSWMERGMRGFVLRFKPIDLAPAIAAER